MSEANYELASDIVSRVNQDGTVIIMKMDDSNSFFKINGIAAEIWSGLSSQKNIDAITADIISNYDVTPEVLAKDFESLVATLLQKNLLNKK
jgi:hypothetical protein